MIVFISIVLLMTITVVIASIFKPKFIITCDSFGSSKFYCVKKLRFLWYNTIIITKSKELAESELKTFMKNS